jgi:glycosyltransferase involved in cell wall biosynthesis
MKDIILSFCIGTYNQADRVFTLVNSILTRKRNDIEVAVTDNASTDHTFDLLTSITDTRFHYYRNESNIGGIANWTRSLTHAKGKYAFFSMDRDLVIQENIEKLCDFLYAHDLAFIFCDSRINKNIIYHDKVKSFLNMYRSYHPTGVIYNTYFLAKIEDLEWFEKEENVGYDPQNFLAGYLFSMGDSARLKNIYWNWQS